MKTRKILSVVLALVLMLSVMVLPTFALDDTYSYVDDTSTGLRISVSKAVEKLEIGAATGGTTTYALSSTVSGYFPQSFSLIFSDATGVTVSLSDTNAYFEFYDADGGYGVVNLSNISCTITVTKGNASCTILCPAPAGSSSSGSGIWGYLPAPGQFTNEGVTTGGWGDAFTSANNGTLKAMVDGNSSTGVSLGAFGGYVILDFGVPHKTNGVVDGGIYNDPGNKYGIDFILYGNMTGTTPEPGCVQVSLDGTNWYDIAGSLYYQTSTTDANGTTPGSEWYYSAVYTNPDYSDDALAAGSAGHYPSNTTYNYTAMLRPNSTATTGNGTVTYNTFHRHSWFPLYNNYFVNRTTSNTPEDMRGKALANLATSKYFGTAYTPTSGTTPSTVTLRGVHLIPRATSSGSVSITASDYLFGYADVHANGSYSHSQVNPYDPDRSTTSGGDPIDISWAVEPMYTYDSDGNATANPDAGKPHYLSAIRYVRVYTGLQVITPPFGENSTEITGVYRATDTGSNSISSNLTVKVGSTTYVDAQGDPFTPGSNTPNLSTIIIPYSSGMTIKLTSSDTYLYVNGSPVTRTSNVYNITSVSSGDVYQIITQRNNESPYIVLLKVS